MNATNETANNSWEKFKSLHGEPIELRDGHYLFPDGYELIHSGHGGVQHIEGPLPNDKVGHLNVRHRILSAKLANEEKAFNAARNEYLTQANAHMNSPSLVPAVPEEAIQCLERGRDRILKLREQIAKIEAKFPENKQREVVEQANSAKSNRAVKIRNAIGAIEI